MRPGVEQQAVAVHAGNHFQVVTLVHITIYIHLLHLCGIAPLVSIEIVIGKREGGVLIQMIMSLGRHPVAVHRFMVHHQEERLVLIFPSVEPLFRVTGNQVRHISQVTGGIFLRNEMRIAIFSLVIKNHPMVEPGRAGNKVPFADDGGFVAICLQYLRQGLLRAVETFRPVLHETVLVTMLTRKDGGTARTGNGVAAVVILENRSFVSDTVDIRSRSDLADGMPVNAHCLTGMVVAHDENDVRALILSILLLSLHRCRRDKREQDKPQREFVFHRFLYQIND